LDNNSQNNGSDLSRASGLEFEIGSSDGLVFDDASESAKPIVEIDLGGSRIEYAEESVIVPDTFEVEEKYTSESFIDDPFRSAPTYIPRFTGASERYRLSGTIDARRAIKESERVRIDPTSESDEERETPHVVVTSSPRLPEDPAEDSIMILKFDSDDRSVSEEDAEEREASILAGVVMEAAHPRSRDAAPEECEPSEPVEASVPEEQSAPEPEPEALPAIADPFVDLTLIDYDAKDTDPESLSPEEAPFESADAKSFGEFTDPRQQDSVKDRFLDKITSIKIRLIGALGIFLFMLTANILRLASIDILVGIGGANSSFAWPVFDLLFALCLFLFAIPEVFRGIKNIFGKVISPELVLIISVCAVALHSIGWMRGGAGEYASLAPVFGISVIFAILASYHRVSSDFAAFKVISKNTVKNILDKRLTRTLPRENLALDGAVDEYKSKIARMFGSAFISDFFSRSGKAVENSFNTVLVTLISLVAAVTTGLISFFVGTGEMSDFSSAFAFVFLTAYPAFMLLTHKLPHHLSSIEAEGESGAFVGESSIYACSDIDVIAYDDTEIFGDDSVTIKKVHLYGKNYNASKAMQDMYAIFSVVGGPLRDVFSDSVGGRGLGVGDVVIEDDGISGSLGERRICCGTLEYMQRHGITVPSDDYKTNVSAGDPTKVMYGADGDEVYVKFFVRYSFSEEFTMLLPGLKSWGIVPLIYTRDPNLNADFFKMLTLGEDLVRVMKKYNLPETEPKIYRRVSAGIVTLGGKLNAINMVLLAKKYTSFQAGISVSELFAMLAGGAVGVAFALSGALTVPAVMIGALQLVWCLYLYLRAKHTFKHKKDTGNS
jgi:hypothetical protein